MFGLLMSAIAVALVSTICAVGLRPRPRPPGAVAWSRRLVFALLGTAVLAIVGGLVDAFVTGGRSRQVALTEILIVVSSLAWLPLTRRWNARAHLCWSMTIFLFVVYLVFMLHWTFQAPLSTAGLVGALALWALEVVASLLGVAYLWEMCDALGSEHWPRRSDVGAQPGEDGYQPFVSLHVPAHEEPPAMVIATVARCSRWTTSATRSSSSTTTPPMRRCGDRSRPGARAMASPSPTSRTGRATSQAPSTTPCVSSPTRGRR